MCSPGILAVLIYSSECHQLNSFVDDKTDVSTQVELQNCEIGAAGVSSIAEAADSNNGSSSKRASAMSLPELAANGVLPESSQETASSSRLHILRLDGNGAGPSAGKALQPLLGHVRELYVSSMGLGDEGLPSETHSLPHI